jgi:hypothetical protein
VPTLLLLLLLPPDINNDDDEEEDGGSCGMVGLDWRSGVGQDRPVAVTVASIGSASPKTHLYLAPSGNSGSVRIVSWTCNMRNTHARERKKEKIETEHETRVINMKHVIGRRQQQTSPSSVAVDIVVGGKEKRGRKGREVGCEPGAFV